MAEVSVKDQLKKLKELQEIDSQIYLYKTELREKPLYIENLKVKFEEKKVSLKKLEDRLKTITVDRKAKEVELLAKEGEIAKDNAQLSLLKTNKEYSAKLSEIEYAKADKSILEEKILFVFEETDSVNAEITKEKGILTEEEKKYLSEKKIVEDLICEIGDKVKVLENKRRQISPEISKANLARYERILENKNGLAFVPVRNQSCGGCHMNLPPQVVNEIKMNESLVCCEMCARILYVEEDL